MSWKFFWLLILSFLVTKSFCAIKENRAPIWRNYLKKELKTEGLFENVPIGTILGTLDAYDPDGEKVYYKCIGESLACFENGTTYLTRELDRELDIKNPDQSKRLLEITFIAIEIRKDNQEPSENRKSLDIYVKDVNDNLPVFKGIPYKATVSELVNVGKTIYSQVFVDDIDTGVNAEITISCDPKDEKAKRACEHFSITTKRVKGTTEGKYYGEIIVKKPLDYEGVPSYVMTLLAKDNGSPLLSARVNVLIDLNDEQDNPPFFVLGPYTFFVKEHISNGSVVGQVTAQDSDVGNPNPVRISLSDGPNKYFVIGKTVSIDGLSHRADVISKGNIDRETSGARYRINITAMEISNGSLDKSAVAFSYVNFEIEDINDSPPVFQHAKYTMAFPEITKFNEKSTIIGTPILVSDSDTNMNAIFSLSITKQTWPGVFGLSTKTGVKVAAVNLVVLNPLKLDYDVLDYRYQTVEITARQTNTTIPLSSKTTVDIHLLDVNDNAPVFRKSIYKASVPENLPVKSSVLTLSATDRDSGENAKIVYKLNGPGSDVFSVDSTGVVFLEKKLDYEKLRTYNLLAFAENLGSRRQETSVEVEIQVTDINDNGPVFKQIPYSTDVTEKTMILRPAINVFATDDDSNSVISYRIAGGNTKDNALMINNKTGNITVRRPLMMEDAPQNSSTIFLKVEAKDNGANPQTSSVVVNINIIDVNNYNPTFLHSTYSASVKELTPGGTSVLTVQARDKDLGNNALITYSITSGSFDQFQINPNTGNVYVASQAILDYDVHPTYAIQVVAEDQGIPRLSGTAILNIKLIDINNKKPMFTSSEYIKSVDEKTPLDTIILVVHATDKDKNSKIEYTINRFSLVAQDAQGLILPTIPNDYRNAFAINRETGEISLKMKLYHSQVATILFEVQARDLNAEGNSNQLKTARVVIITKSSQRTRPFFLPEIPGQTKKIFKLELPEDKQVGFSVTAVRAKDPTNGQFVLQYILAPSSQNQDFFNITKNGEVILIKKLDYENKNNSNPLKFDIMAIADPQRNATAGVEITIKDINDNVPVFQQDSYSFSVKESTRYPNNVGQVLATDNDQGEFSQIIYSLEGLNHEDFKIKEFGEIIVSSTAILNYETTKKYALLVSATDNPLGQVKKKSVVKLTINVIDVNDNKPVFKLPPEYNFTVLEDILANTFIGKVTATDKDSGNNGKLSYSFKYFQPDVTQYFNIKEDTGQIETAIDFAGVNNLRDSFSFTVWASDQGIPVLSASATVTVTINYLITKEPRISRPYLGQNVTIYENQPGGTFVFKASAKARQSSSVIYSFNDFNGNTSKVFAIDPKNGIITTNIPLDRESHNIYKVVIKAIDRLNTSYTSMRQLNVFVGDIDDNRPSFTSCSSVSDIKQVNIVENSAVNYYVTQVTGCDKDFNTNKMAYVWADYKTCKNTNKKAFTLDNISGVILTNIVFDYENITMYMLCVRVVRFREMKTLPTSTDPGEFQTIIVNIIDTNDNGPKFDRIKESAVIYEKSPSGSKVAIVTAKDPDSFRFKKVKYSIEKIECYIPESDAFYSTENAFVINRNDGRILTNLPNYIKFVRSHFIVTIRAEDELNSNYYSTMKYTIYVIQPRQQTSIVLPGTLDVSQPSSAELMSKLNELGLGKFVIKNLDYQRKLNDPNSHITNLCFVVEKDGKILSLSETQDILKNDKAQNIMEKYTSTSVTSSCNPETTRESSGTPMWWVLIALAIIIFICCILLIVAISLLYKSHKRFMETENTSLLN